MRKTFGLGVLIIGTAALGWWAQGHQARRIQAEITVAAQDVVATSVHSAQVNISGRDIHLSGIMDGKGEETALLDALNKVPGRRVVTEDVHVLDKASPFVLKIAKTDSGFAATGDVPTEALRGVLAKTLGEQAAGLRLAAGAPKGWSELAQGGLAALAPLSKGDMDLSDSTLTISGEALGPEQAAAVDAALSDLTEGTVKREITLLDDGTPAIFTLDYGADKGGSLDGKLPKGLQSADLAAAIGLPSLAGTPRMGVLGNSANAMDYAALKDWLGKVETLKLTAGPDGRVVVITVQPGVDADAMKAALTKAGFDTTVKSEVPKGSNGDKRTNAATGQNQRFMGGYWLAVPSFAPDLPTCQSSADSVLADGKITFVSGSDELDPTAVRVINNLAAVLARCAEDAGLKAEIGGYTDSSGDPVANLGLSQRRASAVRLQLVARGVPATALRAVGHGDADPVADNASEEGRAQNRRTTITWSR